MKSLRLLLALLALPLLASAAPINILVTFGTPPAHSGIPPAPRFAYFSLGNSTYGSTASADVPRLGRADLVVLTSYEGVGTSVASAYGSNMNGLVSQIQNQGNGAGNTIVNVYYLPDTDGTNPIATPAYPQYKTHVEAMNWDLYNLGTSGTKTQNYFNSAWTMANSTTNAPSDGAGFKVEDYATQFVYNYFVTGTFGGAHQATDKAPTMQGGFHDNVVLGATTSADWVRTGVGQQSFGGSADASYRAGLALGFNWLKNNAPAFLRLGNVANWGCTVCTQGSSTPGVVDNLLNGGLIELLIGAASYSVESFSDFAHTKAIYQFCMAHTVPNAVTKIQACMPGLYWDTNGRDYLSNNVAPWNADPNWQPARYQYTFALQDDGIPAISAFPINTNYNSHYYVWLDEQAVNASTLIATGEASSTTGKGYMGQAIDPPWTQLPNGVYARRYRNGPNTWVALNNPKGNGSQTVTISQIAGGFGHFHAFTGTQAPTINDGALHTAHAMTDRDGWIAEVVP